VVAQRSFYIFSNGAMRRKDNTVFIETESGKRYLPIETVEELHVFGEVDISKKFLDYASQREIIVHFYNYYGYYSGTYYPREHRNSGYMTVKQVQHYLDPERRLTLARTFVRGSLLNIRQVIRYYAGRGKSGLGDFQEKLEESLNSIPNIDTIDRLMALEGEARQIYYAQWDTIVERPEFAFEKRTRRPPNNRMNALISFGNSMLYTAVLSEIYKTHLDPRIGYLHATNFRKFTLNLDVAEVFKPLAVDRIIFNLIGKNMIQPKDFEEELGGIYLSEAGRKRFVEQFDSQLKTTIQHRDLGRSISYRSLIRLELHKIEKHVLEEQPYEPYVSRW
jgi:CRISPR-associated protein Cas1